MTGGDAQEKNFLIVDAVTVDRESRTFDYTYDHRNRLTSVSIKNPQGVEVERVDYTYDVYDRQLARDYREGDQAAKRQVWIYDGDNAALLYDVDPTSGAATLAQRLYYTGTDQLLAVHDAVHDRMLWTLTDRQGSVRGLWGRETDTSTPGLLVYREYGPFGDLTEKNLLPAGEQIFVSAAYTGRDYDPAVELYNYRSRHYDPQLGTFTQEDGIGIAADLNRYRYVGNSPTNATDPSGHISVITGLIGVGIGAVGGAINAYINDEDILVGAGKGALIGGIAGLTAGLASMAVSGYLGGTAASSALVGTGTAYFAGNTVGAAAGDLASQGLSIAMGDQKSFSWQQLAGATATGALLGPLSVGAGRMFAASTVAKGALRPLFMAGGSAASGAAGNAISQGINIASGAQESWDWNQFKIAAAMGGLGGLAGNYAGLFDKTCFRAGTPLVCEGGHKQVEDLQVGDRLAARDEFDPDGPIEFKAIEEVFVRRGLILEVTVAGQTIGTTAEHPFYVFERGWTPAGELQVGDLLATADGRYLPVEKLHQTGNLETVYNFRVADHHTYFVADQHWGFEVWVHNSNYNRVAPVGGLKGGTYKLLDSDGVVRRTGRTKDLDVREKQLGRNPETQDLDFVVDRRTDDYYEQRGREQIIYDMHPSALPENGGLNRIRAIRENHELFDDYINAGKRI